LHYILPLHVLKNIIKYIDILIILINNINWKITDRIMNIGNVYKILFIIVWEKLYLLIKYMENFKIFYKNNFKKKLEKAVCVCACVWSVYMCNLSFITQYLFATLKQIFPFPHNVEIS